jgi:hypothetical protein
VKGITRATQVDAERRHNLSHSPPRHREEFGVQTRLSPAIIQVTHEMIEIWQR